MTIKQLNIKKRERENILKIYIIWIKKNDEIEGLEIQ